MSTTAFDSGYLAFFTFTFVLVVTPGSTTAVVVRNTLEGGRRAGYLTALGAALANTSIAIACGLGLSVLVSVWPGSLRSDPYRRRAVSRLARRDELVSRVAAGRRRHPPGARSE